MNALNETNQLSSAAPTCRACGRPQDSHWPVHLVREQMFGLGTSHQYGECPDCGSLSLAQVPNLASYYPTDYYSQRQSQRPAIVELARWLIDWLALNIPGVSSRSPLPYLRRFKITRARRVLDVGCGAGHLLSRLSRLGYCDLQGVDLFLEGTTETSQFRLIEGTVSDLPDERFFDLVILSHTLEHVPQPLETLRAIARRLRPSGYVVVTVPVLGWAWRRYRSNWVQLDAPRHLTLFSLKGLEEVIASADLRLIERRFDSTAFQFWGSQAYKKGLPLVDFLPPFGTPAWLWLQLKSLLWHPVASLLNLLKTGDQVTVVLQCKAPYN